MINREEEFIGVISYADLRKAYQQLTRSRREHSRARSRRGHGAHRDRRRQSLAEPRRADRGRIDADERRERKREEGGARLAQSAFPAESSRAGRGLRGRIRQRRRDRAARGAPARRARRSVAAPFARAHRRDRSRASREALEASDARARPVGARGVPAANLRRRARALPRPAAAARGGRGAPAHGLSAGLGGPRDGLARPELPRRADRGRHARAAAESASRAICAGCSSSTRSAGSRARSTSRIS